MNLTVLSFVFGYKHHSPLKEFVGMTAMKYDIPQPELRKRSVAAKTSIGIKLIDVGKLQYMLLVFHIPN